MTSDDELETEAVAAARHGDREAFETLYRLHVGRVHALCLRIVRDRERALDLVQESFVRAWTRLDDYRGDSRFGTWLHRLSVNVVLGELRSRRREADRIERAALESYLQRVSEVMPTTSLALERAIAELPDRAREAVLLRDLEGYSYAEIATLMKVSEGTVKSQVHRGRKLLLEAMGE